MSYFSFGQDDPCGSGQELSSSGTCECLPGHVPVPQGGCVPGPGATSSFNVCPPGWMTNDATGECTDPSGSTAECFTGLVRNPATGECVMPGTVGSGHAITSPVPTPAPAPPDPNQSGLSALAPVNPWLVGGIAALLGVGMIALAMGAKKATPNRRKASSPLGVLVAREILKGDFSSARSMAGGRSSWTVTEARALLGACKEAGRRWGKGAESSCRNIVWGDSSTGGRTVSPNPRRKSKRPPKKWMRDCVRGASESAVDPGAACGALWYHKMSASQRKAAKRRSYGR